MHVIETQIHHHEHNVGAVCSTLTVAQEFRIIHRMEVQALIALEGWILAPDPIHPRHKLLQAMTLLQVPRTDLVLFRIEIFLTAFEAWTRLAEFEGWTIDAIGGAERGGQHQAYEKGRSATVLQILRENIRGVRPQMWAEILTDVGPGQFGEVARDLLLEVLPVRPIKVKWINVLIFLGMIFRILDGAIGAPPEPLRVLPHIGMIGGALEGDVESYLYPILPGCGDQASEIVQGPKLWMDSCMPAGGRSNGPGTAWIIGGGHGGIVLALAVDLANRMNGREIEDVKTHMRQIGQTCLTILERPVLAWQ